MLRFLARKVINLEHNLPDSLGGGEAFLEELPFGLQFHLCKLIWSNHLIIIWSLTKYFLFNLRGECTCWVSLWPGGEYGGSLPLSGGLSGNACLKRKYRITNEHKNICILVSTIFPHKFLKIVTLKEHLYTYYIKKKKKERCIKPWSAYEYLKTCKVSNDLIHTRLIF